MRRLVDEIEGFAQEGCHSHRFLRGGAHWAGAQDALTPDLERDSANVKSIESGVRPNGRSSGGSTSFAVGTGAA